MTTNYANPAQIRAGIMTYFRLEELVCPHAHQKFGERAWTFLDTGLLANLLYVRTELGHPVTVNDWHRGGRFKERGLRCNLCQAVWERTRTHVPYLSTHVQGRAADFDIRGLSATQARQWILAHADELPHPCRLEDKVNWTHMDTRNPGGDHRVTLFNP